MAEKYMECFHCRSGTREVGFDVYTCEDCGFTQQKMGVDLLHYIQGPEYYTYHTRLGEDCVSERVNFIGSPTKS